MGVIRFIYGNKRGVGKTSLNTAFAIWEMFGIDNYRSCLAKIDVLESDYEINDNCKFSQGLTILKTNILDI